MKTFTPDELDKEIYLKYKNIIELYKISNIYLIKDKYDIKENTLIDNKIYVTKPLIESLPVNEYFTIVCMSKPNESCKTYKLKSLEKLLEEYNSVREVEEPTNKSNKIEFHNYGDEEDKYVNQELEDDLSDEFEHDSLDEMIDKEYDEEINEEEDY